MLCVTRPLMLLVAAAFAADAGAQVRPINDTGQITCYNGAATTGTVSGGTFDPEAPGFDQQDCTMGAAAADVLGGMAKFGGSTVPGRDYSKIGNDGSELPATATLGPNSGDWACTRDNITGLTWEVKTTSGFRSLSHTYSWFDTNAAINGGQPGFLVGPAGCNATLANCNTTAYRNAINALSGLDRLCGATDWRLPTAFELRSLVDLGVVSGPTIDITWFPNTRNDHYWTGVNFAPNELAARLVHFGSGVVTHGPKGESRHIRLVRGGF